MRFGAFRKSKQAAKGEILFQGRLSVVGVLVPWVRRILGVGLVLAAVSALCSQLGPPQASAGAFFASAVGEWVGMCEQTTDGDAADDKYFRAVVTKVDEDTFESRFEYYRFDREAGAPLRVGDMLVRTTVNPDGTAVNTVTGQGTVLVDYDPKPQEYELSEVLTCTGPNSLEGRGSGRVKVGGLPFGLGKNGRISEAESTWSLADGVMTVHQSLKAGFRVLFFTKSFHIEAYYTAERGSDVAALIARQTQVAPEQSVGYVHEG